MCRLLESITRSSYQQTGHEDGLVDQNFSEGQVGESPIEIVEQAPSPPLRSDTGDSSKHFCVYTATCM